MAGSEECEGMNGVLLGEKERLGEEGEGMKQMKGVLLGVKQVKK